MDSFEIRTLCLNKQIIISMACLKRNKSQTSSCGSCLYQAIDETSDFQIWIDLISNSSASLSSDSDSEDALFIVKVHKCVLNAHSPVLEEYIRYKNQFEFRVDVQDKVEVKAILTIIQWMYDQEPLLIHPLENELIQAIQKRCIAWQMPNLYARTTSLTTLSKYPRILNDCGDLLLAHGNGDYRLVLVDPTCIHTDPTVIWTHKVVLVSMSHVWRKACFDQHYFDMMIHLPLAMHLPFTWLIRHLYVRDLKQVPADFYHDIYQLCQMLEMLPEIQSEFSDSEMQALSETESKIGAKNGTKPKMKMNEHEKNPWSGRLRQRTSVMNKEEFIHHNLPSPPDDEMVPVTNVLARKSDNVAGRRRLSRIPIAGE